jgi:esterase/lipase superfamily enzyme
MDVIAAALADLRFGLRFAATRYHSYALMEDPADNSGLFLQLSNERNGDADVLDSVADVNELGQIDPMFNAHTAGPLLGMGEGPPPSAASAVYRVQRAENTLGRMAAQLGSLAPNRQLVNALQSVRGHIERSRKSLQAARRRAQNLDRGETGASYGALGEALADGQQVVVWFGTNRRCASRGRFQSERADILTYGRCKVFVPDNREIGSLGGGLFRRVLRGDDRVVLQDTDVLEEHRFWALMASEVASLQANDRQGLVFLHGYNTKFEDAARRTAQLKVDLAHKGPAGFFSWPSLGNRAGYAGDEAAIEGSERPIRNFLVDFAERSGASAVHIIAHSMGNRGLLRAMDAIANAAASSTPVRFGQVFLAAPDVDAQLFQSLAAAYGQLSMRATLYVTSNDRAMGLSRRYHRFARVGLTPPVATVPGIDTIDASRVNIGLLGHSYAAETRSVLSDIYSLMQNDTAPDKRFGLRKALGGKAAHWEFIR